MILLAVACLSALGRPTPSSTCANLLQEASSNLFTSKSPAALLRVCDSGCDYEGHSMLASVCSTLHKAHKTGGANLARRLVTTDQAAACRPMEQWSTPRALAWIRKEVDNRTADILESKGVDGNSLSGLTEASTRELYDFGIPMNSTAKLLEAVRFREVGIRKRLAPTDDPCSNFFAGTSGATTKAESVIVNLNIEKILNIDDTQYEFSAKMLVAIVWFDDRFQYLPTHGGDIGDCEVPVYDASGLPPTTCYDMLLGRKPLPIYFQNTKEEPQILAENKWAWTTPFNMVLSIQYVSATFNMEMAFGDFPFDTQKLTMVMKSRWDQSNQWILMDTISISSLKAPGWTVTKVSNESSFDPMSSAFRRTMDPQPQSKPGTLLSISRTDGNTHPVQPTGFSFSVQNLVVDVKRDSEFYVSNMILPIWYLTVGFHLLCKATYNSPLSGYSGFLGRCTSLTHYPSTLGSVLSSQLCSPSSHSRSS